MKRLFLLILLPLFLISCGNSSVLPSIRDGNNKIVSCFFSSSSVYKDIVFNVSYDSKNKTPSLVFLNLDTKKYPKLVAETDSRLSIQFHNSSKEQILLSIFHKTGKFEMSSGGSSMHGECEEIK